VGPIGSLKQLQNNLKASPKHYGTGVQSPGMEIREQHKGVFQHAGAFSEVRRDMCRRFIQDSLLLHPWFIAFIRGSSFAVLVD
jgi:hypothetical protein